MSNWIDGEDIDEVKKLLLCRKIVEVHRINDKCGELTLDNGTILCVVANDACAGGGCDKGEWYLDALNTCDNAITNVKLVHDRRGGFEDLQIFVYAEDKQIKAIDVYGDEGNGYYGRGFTISIEKP